MENEIKAFIDNIITGKKHSCSTDAKEGIEALRIAELIDSQSIERKGINMIPMVDLKTQYELLKSEINEAINEVLVSTNFHSRT